jgi:hypothetical protein
MSDALFNGLGKGIDAQILDRAESERKNTLEQTKRWALAVGEQLSHLPPTRKEMETSDWRAGAGDMTPTQVGTSASTPQESANDDESRLIVRVDAGDLGEVALLVDRQKGALRVTVGVQGAAAQAAVEVERAALMQSLKNAGISVESVDVVRTSSVGTVLAPRPGESASNQSPDNSEHTVADNEANRRRLARKLNLIG